MFPSRFFRFNSFFAHETRGLYIVFVHPWLVVITLFIYFIVVEKIVVNYLYVKLLRW